VHESNRNKERGGDAAGTFVRFVIEVDRGIVRAVPTPESGEAFAKLVAARTRLTEITKELNRASAQMHVSNEGRQLYAQLQQEWEDAFQQFETATDEFSAVAHRVKDQLEERKK
jgi:hypothetical protein